MAITKSVLVRIRRLGNIWTTCGIGVEPPTVRLSEPGIYHVCTKLVPGQVVRLPVNHPLARHKLCEIVYGTEDDEFIRPWVFPDPASAVMADPSQSHMSAEQIANGLALLAGAVRNQTAHNAKAQEKREELREEDAAEPEPELYQDEPAREASRELAEIFDDAEVVTDDGEPAPVAPAPRTGARGGGRRRQ